MRQQINFQAEPPCLEEIRYMVRKVFAERDEAVAIDVAEDKRFYWRLSFFLVAAVCFASPWALSAWGWVSALVAVGVASIGFFIWVGRKKPKAVEAFIIEFAAYCMYDLDLDRKLVTENYLVTPVEAISLERLVDISSDQAFAGLREYVSRVLAQRDLTSFEYGQLIVEYEMQRRKLDEACRASRAEGARKKLHALVSVDPDDAQPAVEQPQ